jgi:hypothetical protein
MTTLEILISDFCIGFVPTAIVFSLVSLGRILSLDSNASTVTAKNFPELPNLSVSEQKRLLHAADRRAFAGWRSFIPAVTYAALLSGSIALPRLLQRIGMIPGSLWAPSAIAILFMAAGLWICRRLEVRRIRPFLLFEIYEFERARARQ